MIDNDNKKFKRGHITTNIIADSSQICQNCFRFGHFTFECNNDQAYNYRPSKTTLLK